jgi:hypothetical protein
MKNLWFVAVVLAFKAGQTTTLPPTFEDAIKLHAASSGPEDAAKAAEAYAAFLATLPESSLVVGGDGASERAFTLHNLALLARNQGGTGIAAALDYAIAAAALLPEDAILRHAEASLLRSAGRPLEAANAWRVTLSLEPNMPHALASLASTVMASFMVSLLYSSIKSRVRFISHALPFLKDLAELSIQSELFFKLSSDSKDTAKALCSLIFLSHVALDQPSYLWQLHHDLADREDLATPGGFERRFAAVNCTLITGWLVLSF